MVLINKTGVVSIQVVCIPPLIIVSRLPFMVAALIVVLVVVVVVCVGHLRRMGRGRAVRWCWGRGWVGRDRHRSRMVCCMGVLVCCLLLLYRGGRGVHGHGSSVLRRCWGRDRGSSRSRGACRWLLGLRVCWGKVVQKGIVLLRLGLYVLRVGVRVVGGFVDLDVGGVQLVAQAACGRTQCSGRADRRGDRCQRLASTSRK